MEIVNGGHVPLVWSWGDGLVPPGGSVMVPDDTVVTPPWTVGDSAPVSGQDGATPPNPSPAPADAVSGPEAGPQDPSRDVQSPENGSQGHPEGTPPPGEGPELHTLPNGDVATGAGTVVGHIDNPATPGNPPQGGEGGAV